jgi:hypothetical protein
VCWSDPDTPRTGFWSLYRKKKGEHGGEENREGLKKRGMQKMKEKKYE